MTKIKAGFDRVLTIELEEVKQSAGGILLPNGLKENQVRCKVVEVGPINSFEGDTNILSEGDIVLTSQYSGATFIEDNVKYRVIELKDILAILSND